MYWAYVGHALRVGGEPWALELPEGENAPAPREVELAGRELRVELSALPGWRASWALQLALARPGEAPQGWRELSPSAPSAALVAPAPGRWLLHLRPWIRACSPALLADPCYERHSRQSSIGAWDAALPAPLKLWAPPTQAEDAPWYELDLGQELYVEEVRVHWPSSAGPRGQLQLNLYSRLDDERQPLFMDRAWSVIAPLEPGPWARVRPCAIGRFLRITLHPASGPAPLELVGVELRAATLTGPTLLESFERAFSLYAQRPLFSCRERLPSGELGGYTRWVTYAEVWSEARALAAGLRALLVEPTLGPQGRVFVGICAPNQPEWVCADLACLMNGFVVVPLPATDSAERLSVLAERCQLACVFGGAEQRERLEQVAQAVPSLAQRIELPPLDRGPAPEPGPGGLAYAALLARGRALLDDFAPAPRDPDDLHTILFSSGSTGTPKGAMRSYRATNAMLTAFGVSQPAVHLSFQPLSHFSERVYLQTLLVFSGQIGFATGAERLFSELALLQPSAVSGPPRVFNLLLDRYREDLARLQAAHPEGDPAELEEVALAGLRGVFGERVQYVGVGSAPPSEALMGFLRRCFGNSRVGEGYGSTECGTITVDDFVRPDVDLRLVDVPELGYFTHDEPARGEILVRTPHMISGYLGDEAATRATFDEDGYFHTGDLGERTPDGRVRVIGRRKSVVKLAQGEFVAPERIEDALRASPLVAQLVIHADSLQASVVALVVPNLGTLAAALGCAADDAEALTGPAARARVLDELRQVGRAAALLPFELPSAIHLELEPLSVERGLATSSNKVDRRAVAERYREVFAALYAGAAPAQGVLDLVREVAASVLGAAPGEGADLADQLGVDSLSGVELVTAVGQRLGREVPLHAWHGAATLEELARRIQVDAGVGARGQGEESATAALARADLAAPLELDRAGLAAPSRFPPRRLLLTGATGFLGAHLLEALVARGDVELRCLVRAPDDDAAAARLRGAAERFGLEASLAGVRALAGDLGQPRLGWSEARWATQAAELDAIVHAAAQVNWVMLYGQLRAANVVGTDRLLALAASARAKAFHFVSTISTAPADGDEASVLDEARALRSSGYGLSKWVAEQRVRAAAAAGLPTTVHRPAMITGHSRRGVANPDDFVNRALRTCLQLGIGLDLRDARCDLTPVDFVAAAIAGLIAGEPPAGQTSHLTNLDASPTWAELSELLGVRPVPYAAFREALLAAGESAPLAPLRAWFPAAGFRMHMGPWPHAETQARLRALEVPAPPPAAELVAAYRAYWTDPARG
ncbi:MAG: thioester reductase domain-containing protein [Planctomycetes bacterium]|nr:thioester reductase domain-containing protein [Planctomycetota bacterium]